MQSVLAMHPGRGQHVCQPHPAPFGGRDRPMGPRVLARDRVHRQQFGATVARERQRRDHAMLLEAGGQLVVGQGERGCRETGWPAMLSAAVAGTCKTPCAAYGVVCGWLLASAIAMTVLRSRRAFGHAQVSRL